MRPRSTAWCAIFFGGIDIVDDAHDLASQSMDLKGTIQTTGASCSVAITPLHLNVSGHQVAPIFLLTLRDRYFSSANEGAFRPTDQFEGFLGEHLLRWLKNAKHSALWHR